MNNEMKSGDETTFQDEFSKRAKKYLGENSDEILVKERYQEISVYMNHLRKKIGSVKNKNYEFLIVPGESFIKIESAQFKVALGESGDFIHIMNVINGEQNSLDKLYKKDEFLLSQTSDEEFTMELLENYLRTTFKDILYHDLRVQ
ncbi:DUF3942 family protein [Chengkuizengella axinellae]|uniref:DUF3942 family protein n=1 Tax=Chengkuizengella axinellae TaxID=3064388 RepID=A0ABT9J4U6_9BACL|nr:DUF3942 family protein [Chengkuizengella sp. 2205SS18-9]MDP5276620.1 DUF3942 family protein [Chengkuizengella sp. 2205SS18-9]